MADRRRINAPPGGTSAPIFTQSTSQSTTKPSQTRRDPNSLRKIFLRTGLVPSASGSSYLELQPTTPVSSTSLLIPSSGSLKLTCTVHGPRPLPRTAPFSPNLLLSTHVKFAPFASRQRRGYLRDASERDLGAHLETALRGVVIGERWPKSAAEVVVTVLEGEEDGGFGGLGMMSVLAGAVTAASAALVDAGIDCVDLVSGGVAAVVEEREGKEGVVLDPSEGEEGRVKTACVVAYLKARDEITELWMKGDAGVASEELIDRAVEAASLSRGVLADAVREAAELRFGTGVQEEGRKQETGTDTAMTG